ncbi:hypothetical protein EBF04_19905 [Streptomyces sp. I6]|nr:hypothetical protein EBF04_19905 [Streptomyces sp. I6]
MTGVSVRVAGVVGAQPAPAPDPAGGVPWPGWVAEPRLPVVLSGSGRQATAHRGRPRELRFHRLTG